MAPTKKIVIGLTYKGNNLGGGISKGVPYAVLTRESPMTALGSKTYKRITNASAAPDRIRSTIRAFLSERDSGQ